MSVDDQQHDCETGHVDDVRISRYRLLSDRSRLNAISGNDHRSIGLSWCPCTVDNIHVLQHYQLLRMNPLRPAIAFVMIIACC